MMARSSFSWTGFNSAPLRVIESNTTGLVLGRTDVFYKGSISSMSLYLGTAYELLYNLEISIYWVT